MQKYKVESRRMHSLPTVCRVVWFLSPLWCTDSWLRDPPVVSRRFQPFAHRDNHWWKDPDRSWRHFRPDWLRIPQHHRAAQGKSGCWSSHISIFCLLLVRQFTTSVALTAVFAFGNYDKNLWSWCRICLCKEPVLLSNIIYFILIHTHTHCSY